MKLSCKERRERRRVDQPEVQRRNRLRKEAERARRDQRMIEKIRGGTPPFTPAVMSWLSRRVEKPASKITVADVKSVSQ